jgi:hypothetical protein
MRDELDEFFLDPTASESAKDGYLVLRANIHVTMAMTRLRLMYVLRLEMGLMIVYIETTF